MSELFEPVSVGIILKHDADDCPFCKSNLNEKPNPVPQSFDDADWEEDPASDTELIGNDAGKLEKNMDDPRPQNWIIDITDLGMEADHKVIPNPHHLIPGNEALKKATELLKWIFAKHGKIENDIGYDVNNKNNGVWLPSNNGMRGVSWWTGDTSIIKKTDYVVKAMDVAQGQFHDRHNNPYSDFVTKILNKIADRMNGIDANSGCPFKTEKGENKKFKPPYALVARLNGVSARIKPHLKKDAKPNEVLITSKLVKQYWKRKG